MDERIIKVERPGGGDLARGYGQRVVLVQNLAPGAAARMGLSYEALREGFSRLVVCDSSGYGADGPYRDKEAYDLLGPLLLRGGVGEGSHIDVSMRETMDEWMGYPIYYAFDGTPPLRTLGPRTPASSQVILTVTTS